MNTKLDGPNISRRGFLAFAGAASSVALLAPRQLFAQDDGLVQIARRSASSGNITVQKLRGNISVLMGAGGNIAVLPGPDGKVLIDAGFAGSRPKITEALASISSDPIKQLINTHWHSTTLMVTNGCTPPVQRSSLTRIRKSAFPQRLEWKAGTSPFRPRLLKQFPQTSSMRSGL
jgi:hypothetical protein